MSCGVNFCDYVNCLRDGSYTIYTGLADGDYTFTLTNKKRSYTFEAPVVGGELSINVADFPEGFFNPYSGEYVLKAGCYDWFCGTYETISFEIRNGEGKYTIECHCAAI